MKSLGLKITQRLFKRQLHHSAYQLLHNFADVNGARQREVEKQLNQISDKNSRNFLLGETSWGFPVEIPLSKLISHSLVLGSTGAGKSYLVLLLLNDLFKTFESKAYLPMGVLDAKGELAAKTIQYLKAFSYGMTKETQETFWQKVQIIDFSRSDLVTPYNILHQHMPVELLVNNRIETFNQIYRGTSALTSRMKAILKYFLLLLIEHKLPITLFEKLCLDPTLVTYLAAKSSDERVRLYFTHRFPKEPRGTVLALRQRVDSLMVSAGVRLSLSANSAPDFRKLQDEGYFVIINVSGPQISRGTSEFLLRIILSDIQQSVFRRIDPDNKFLWCLDEAQVLYKDAASRENMNDLLTMARSFGSYFMLLTQSLTSAVHDADILNSILSNIHWLLMFRSTLRDAKLIAPALPVTGTVLSKQRFPYDQQKFLSKDQELKMNLEEITHFPERVGYLWLRSNLPFAIKIRTRQLGTPEQTAGCSREELKNICLENQTGNLVSKERIKSDYKAKEESLMQQIPETSASGAIARKVPGEIIKQLEQTYLKKTGKNKNGL
jgi:hypothetical protein